MEENNFCQSCSMPITEPEHYGTEANGARSEDYCTYCYENGAFKNTMTMEEMIVFCANHVEEWDMNFTRDEAIAGMRQHFPKLKRWKKE